MNRVKYSFLASAFCLSVFSAHLVTTAKAEQTYYGHDPAFDGCCGNDYFSTDCCGPPWTATADAVFLTRSDPGPRGVLFDAATDAELYNFDEFNFDYQTGQRLRLLRRVG